MKLNNTNIIQIGEGKATMTFHIKLTNRAMIEFESMSDKDLSSMKGTEDLLKLFYCTAKAGAKSEGLPFDITYQQFVDVTDECYFELITKFGEALAELGGDRKKLVSKKLT